MEHALLRLPTARRGALSLETIKVKLVYSLTINPDIDDFRQQ